MCARWASGAAITWTEKRKFVSVVGLLLLSVHPFHTFTTFLFAMSCSFFINTVFHLLLIFFCYLDDVSRLHRWVDYQWSFSFFKNNSLLWVNTWLNFIKVSSCSVVFIEIFTFIGIKNSLEIHSETKKHFSSLRLASWNIKILWTNF